MRWGYRSVQTQWSEKHRKLYRKRHKHSTSCRLLRLHINICQFLIWLTPCQGVEQMVDDGCRKILLLTHLLPRINDKATMTYTSLCVSTCESVSVHFVWSSVQCVLHCGVIATCLQIPLTHTCYLVHGLLLVASTDTVASQSSWGPFDRFGPRGPTPRP